MGTCKLDLSRQFAVFTGQLEDAHGIVVEGQRAGLAKNETKALVQLLHGQIACMIDGCERIASE